MKKLIPLVVFIISILVMTVSAQEDSPTRTPATRENILEDAVIDLLQPQMYSAVENYYGTAKEIGFMCQRVIEIKKLDHPGSWMFEVKLEGLTFTGAHNPMDTFTVTVKSDDTTEGKWVLQDYEIKI